MTQYILVYLGGNPPSTPEEGQQHFVKYKEWLASLGEAVTSPMNPIKGTQSVQPEGEVGAGRSGMSGYTIVEAESMDAAIELAKGCPFLDIGGTLEVSELVRM